MFKHGSWIPISSKFSILAICLPQFLNTPFFFDISDTIARYPMPWRVHSEVVVLELLDDRSETGCFCTEEEGSSYLCWEYGKNMEKPRSTEVFEGKRSSLNMDLSNVEISREQNDELMKLNGFP